MTSYLHKCLAIIFSLIAMSAVTASIAATHTSDIQLHDAPDFGVSQPSDAAQQKTKAKLCTKLHAKTPYRKKCGGKVNLPPASARSRNTGDKEEHPLSWLASINGLSWFSAYLPSQFKELDGHYYSIRGPTGSRAAFWFIYALAARMRN